jgi:hypothetical protein
MTSKTGNRLFALPMPQVRSLLTPLDVLGRIKSARVVGLSLALSQIVCRSVYLLIESLSNVENDILVIVLLGPSKIEISGKSSLAADVYFPQARAALEG